MAKKIKSKGFSSQNMDSGVLYWFFNSSGFKTVTLVFFYIVFLASILDGIYGMVRSFRSIIALDASILPTNVGLFFCRVFIPVIVWLLSTASEWFSYKRRRLTAFLIVVLHAAEVVIEHVLRAIMLVTGSFLLYIPIDGSISPNVVVYFGYYIVGVSYLLVSVFFYKLLLTNTFDKLTRDRINAFYLTDYFSDFYVRKKYSYPLEFIKYLETGKKYEISMKDRYLHTLCVGSTGTGKTSSCATPALEHDFVVKATNIDIQKEIVESWLKEGKVRIKQAFDENEFNLNYFEGVGKSAKKYNKKLASLAKRIPNAGMTIMCPNAAFADEVCKIAASKKLKVNRIDPVHGTYGGTKSDCVGMNPLYVDPTLCEKDPDRYFEQVIKTATLFSEVNQAVYDESGRTDPYFAGVNKNMAVNAAVVMIVAMPLAENRVATIPDVLRVLNNFEQIKPYREKIIERFGLDMAGVVGRKESAIGRARVVDALQIYIDGIDVDFLGQNAADMNKQCTGLRNIIKDSIALPRIRKILTSQNIINFDDILKNGEITVVNFDLALGRDASTSFGLFFMLNFINAVMRRDRATRIPHFFYIDEAHVLLHPRMEYCATLFRQYKVGCMFFIQSLSQFDKSESTKYLRSTFTGNMAHQLLFGRASLDEMRYYSEIGGTKKEVETEESIRLSALTVSNPMLNTSISNSVVENEIVSETDIRYRRFLECYVYSVRRSMPLRPFIGKVSFLPHETGVCLERYTVDWERYFDVNTLHPSMPSEISLNSSFTKTSATSINNSDDGAVSRNVADLSPMSNVSLQVEDVDSAEPKDCHLLSTDEEIVDMPDTDSDVYTEVY